MAGTLKCSLGAFLSALALAVPAVGAEPERVKSAPSAPLAFAGDLIDQAIRNRYGIEIAELEDFLIDPADGRVAFAILRAGGRFEPRSEIRALPLPDERVDALPGNLRADIAEVKLRNLQTVEEALAELEPGKRAKLVSVRSILEADLAGTQGQDLGEVSDVAIDVPRGKAAYVLVEYGGSWLRKGKRVALERPAMQSAGGTLTVVADAGQLEQAKAFDPGHAPRVQEVTTWTRIRNEFVPP